MKPLEPGRLYTVQARHNFRRERSTYVAHVVVEQVIVAIQYNDTQQARSDIVKMCPRSCLFEYDPLGFFTLNGVGIYNTDVITYNRNSGIVTHRSAK